MEFDFEIEGGLSSFGGDTPVGLFDTEAYIKLEVRVSKVSERKRAFR